MRAVVIDAPGRIRVDNVPDPTPGQMKCSFEWVHVVSVAPICILLMASHRWPATLSSPVTEFAGEVVALGYDIAQSNGNGEANITVGSRVAIDPNLYCGHCDLCRTGHENLCLNYAAARCHNERCHCSIRSGAHGVSLSGCLIPCHCAKAR